MSALNFKKCDHNIGWISFVDPGQNCDPLEALEELADILSNINQDKYITGTVIDVDGALCLAPSIYDLADGKLSETRILGIVEKTTDVFNQIKNLRTPSVAIMKGSCRGSMFDLGLACRFRLSTNDADFSYQEVGLGLVPYSYAPRWLPDIIGLKSALDLFITARVIHVEKAYKIGLVDNIIHHDDIIDAAKAAILTSTSLIAVAKRKPSIGFLSFETNPIGRKLIYKKAKELISEKAKKPKKAAFKIIDAMLATENLPLSQVKSELTQTYINLLKTDESLALLYLAKAKEKTKKALQELKSKEENFSLKTTFIGAGTIASKIAEKLLSREIKIRFVDPKKENLARCLNQTVQKLNKKAKSLDFEPRQKMMLASCRPDLPQEGKSAVLVETIPEARKRAMQNHLSKSGLVLAKSPCLSHTACFTLKENIFPESLPYTFSFRYFEATDQLSVIELTLPPLPCPESLAKVVSFLEKISPAIILVEDKVGHFLPNVFAYYFAESLRLVDEGFSQSVIDKAMVDFGFHLGPFAFAQKMGLKTWRNIFHHLSNRYQDLTPKQHIWSKIEENQTIRDEGYEAKDLHTIQTRLIYSMINQCAKLVRENTVKSSSDCDLAVVLGLGFPDFLGGPLKYIRSIGLEKAFEQFSGLSKHYGARFQPRLFFYPRHEPVTKKTVSKKRYHKAN